MDIWVLTGHILDGMIYCLREVFRNTFVKKYEQPKNNFGDTGAKIVLMFSISIFKILVAVEKRSEVPL